MRKLSPGENHKASNWEANPNATAIMLGSLSFILIFFMIFLWFFYDLPFFNPESCFCLFFYFLKTYLSLSLRTEDLWWWSMNVLSWYDYSSPLPHKPSEKRNLCIFSSSLYSRVKFFTWEELNRVLTRCISQGFIRRWLRAHILILSSLGTSWVTLGKLLASWANIISGNSCSSIG